MAPDRERPGLLSAGSLSHRGHALAARMERHASCSAWDEDHETDDVMAEVLTRSASAAQREAREPLPPPSLQPEPARTRPNPPEPTNPLTH